MPTKKRIKKKTYKEFMSWLEGVESMQEKDWVPNLQQWQTIREMLNNVKPEEVEVSSRPPARPVQGVTGEPVARIVEPPGGFRPAPQIPAVQPQQSLLEQPKQQKVQPMPQPSGLSQVPKVPNSKEAMLNPGQEHTENEFL